MSRGRGAPAGNRNAAKEETETNDDNVIVCSPAPAAKEETETNNDNIIVCLPAPAAKEETETNNDNIIVCLPAPAPKPQQGTSLSYAVRRLSRERPDLLEKVKAGELTVHAAMVQAGFRKVPTPLELLKKVWSKASAEERRAFAEWVFTEEA